MLATAISLLTEVGEEGMPARSGSSMPSLATGIDGALIPLFINAT